MKEIIVQNIASRIKSGNKDVPKEEQVVIDPASLLLISNMVTGLIKAIIACRNKNTQPAEEVDEQTVSYVNKPSWLQKRLVKRTVRKELGLVKYIFTGRRYVQALLSEGRELTKEEIAQAIAEQSGKI